jgi:hypothetical protein
MLLIFIVAVVATSIGLGCLFVALSEKWRNWPVLLRWKRKSRRGL